MSDLFNVCLTPAEDCALTVTCWNHASHHKDCCHLSFSVTHGSQAEFGCPRFSPFPETEDDGFVTMYSSQGALR
jgi:hypothetical protein